MTRVHYGIPPDRMVRQSPEMNLLERAHFEKPDFLVEKVIDLQLFT